MGLLQRNLKMQPGLMRSAPDQEPINPVQIQPKQIDITINMDTIYP
jgi:hypothetical protein